MTGRISRVRGTGAVARAEVAAPGLFWAHRLFLALAGLALCMVISGCAAVYRNHGYVPTDVDLEQVEVGVDTRETVAEKVGRPSAAGLLNDVGWYYVQSRWKHYGPREPEEVDRQVVAITFSDNGVVQNVERFGLEQGRAVVLSRRVTESSVQGLSFLRQVFGNLGNITPDALRRGGL